VDGITTVEPKTWEYDPEKDAWNQKAELDPARGGLAGAVLQNRLLVFGGEGNPAAMSNGVYPDIDAYDPATDTWTQIGTMDGGGAIYSIGCTGHGVAMTQMNGRIIRDLVLDRKTQLTDSWFVNQRILPMPPEPLLSMATRSVATAMAVDDWWCDRGQAQG